MEAAVPETVFAAESAVAQAALARPQPRVGEAAALPSIALPVWTGRACICWLSACLPFAFAGHDALASLRFAAPAAAAWLLVGVLERGDGGRKAAYAGIPRAAWTAALGLVLLCAVARWVPQAVPLRPLVLLSAAGLVLLSPLWERNVGAALVHSKRVLALCTSPAELRLLAALDESPSPYRLVGVVTAGGPAGVAGPAPLLGSLDELAQVVEETDPDVLVVGEPGERHGTLAAATRLARSGTAVVGAGELFEHAYARLPLPHLPRTWFLDTFRLGRASGSAAKRAFDAVAAVLGLVVGAPLLLLAAAAVRTTRGPVLYRQVRLGEDGRLFTMFKFRTMVEEAEASGPVWAALDDPRATRVGLFLRRTRLDELPQLWNVLEGTMSIVGPRPERPELDSELASAVPHWRRRRLLKPGITGWAQINDGYAADTAGAQRKLSYDLWYLRHRSLAVDLAICLRTVGRLTRGAR